MRSKQRTQHAARQHHHTQAGRGSPGLATTTPRSPQDRRNLEYDQLVRTALLRAGGQSFTVEFSGGLRELPGLGTRGPPGPPARGGAGACAEERSNPASTSNPTVPRPHGSGDLARHAGTSGCGAGTHGPTEAISKKGNFPEGSSHPAQPPKGPEDPRAGSQPAGHLAGGPCHAAPKAQTRTPLGSGRRRPGHEQGAAEGPGAVTPRARPPHGPPPRGRGQGATPPPRALPAASGVPLQPVPAPAPQSWGAPRGCPATGVRSGLAAHRHCARRHLWPLHAPPPKPARPGLPPAPRRAPPAQQL